MLFRSLPVRKSAGLLPRAVAIVGANFNFALLLLPEARIGETWNTISAALILAGTAGATVVLIWLGRAFSIFPEARQLIAHGPYRVVRHPLYLAEIVATIGITLRYRQPWAILVALVAIGLQLRRMAFEEDILTDAFPGYAVYARHTARLVPGLY
jgi:protein-S-isoprenylcysteine O-methyltransferase Ste14